jgi:WD40 repeat protein
MSHDARHCIYERLSRRDLRAMACVCKELSAEVPAAVAHMFSHAHVFPAPLTLHPRETAMIDVPSNSHDAVFSRGSGALLAVVDGNGTVQMRDSATGKVRWSVAGHGGFASRCAFLRDNTLLATASEDKTVKLWSTSDGSLVSTLTGHFDFVHCVACSPVADVLLSGDGQGVTKVWDAMTASELRTLSSHTEWVTAAAFNASGELAATGCYDGRIRIFDARADWQLLSTVTAHRENLWMWALRFSPVASSPLLASGSNDGTAKLWDVSDPCQPRLLRTLSGHHSSVLSVSFSPDGTLLATASSDGSFKVWRVADATLLCSVAAHTGWVWAVAFHPCDSSVLVTCSWDNTMKLWQL